MPLLHNHAAAFSRLLTGEGLAQVDTPLTRIPPTVISHSKDLVNPFGFLDSWPIAQLERAFQQSQNMLAKLLPHSRHTTATRSGHYIQLEQPNLVANEIRRMIRRCEGTDPGRWFVAAARI
ncbi:MAG: hypothetical protein WBW62_12345 [Solirubrobacterales bacterium]